MWKKEIIVVVFRHTLRIFSKNSFGRCAFTPLCSAHPRIKGIYGSALGSGLTQIFLSLQKHFVYPKRYTQFKKYFSKMSNDDRLSKKNKFDFFENKRGDNWCFFHFVPKTNYLYILMLMNQYEKRQYKQ